MSNDVMKDEVKLLVSTAKIFHNVIKSLSYTKYV